MTSPDLYILDRLDDYYEAISKTSQPNQCVSYLGAGCEQYMNLLSTHTDLSIVQVNLISFYIESKILLNFYLEEAEIYVAVVACLLLSMIFNLPFLFRLFYLCN